MKLNMKNFGGSPKEKVDLLNGILARCPLPDLVKNLKGEGFNVAESETQKKLVMEALIAGELSDFELGDERMEWFEWMDESHEKWAKFRELNTYRNYFENGNSPLEKISQSVYAICAIMRNEHWGMVKALGEAENEEAKWRLAGLDSKYSVGEVVKEWLKEKVKAGQNVNYEGLFDNQPAFARGTGFLIGKNLLLTAAHVLEDENGLIDGPALQVGSNLRFVFNYYCVSDDVLSPDVFAVKGTFIRKGQGFWDDWAIVQLEDDERLSAIEPLKLSKAFKPVVTNTAFYSWGFPLGTPMKVSLVGRKLFNLGSNRFTCNLDMSNGNSGSPIISLSGGIVHGLLLAGVPEFELVENLQRGEKTYKRRELTIGDIFRLKAGEHCQSIHSIYPHLSDLLLENLIF